MSTPAVAGAAAIVRQYVNEKFPDLSPKQKVELINSLLMCTSTPLKDKNGVEYPVIKQGAGMINVLSAVASPCVLTTESSVRPKLELGSDPSRSGKYVLEFDVENFGSTTMSYEIVPVLQTSGYEWQDQGTRATWVTTLECTQLTDKMSFTTNHTNNIVAVAAGAKEHITVTITINDEAHTLLNEIFPYGAYIEGYCYLRAQATDEGAVYPNLSICYLGYYGDWSEVPVVDQSFYYDTPDKQLGMMSYPNTAGSKYRASYYEIGMNPYFEDSEDFTFLADRGSISPNKDKYYDAVDVLSLIHISEPTRPY